MHEAPAAPRIEASAVHVVRGSRVVLRGVSVQVAPGEIVAVLGPSGAGKSTLFRALVGDDAVASGRVVLDGTDVTSMPVWKRARAGIGYVPQTPSVLWDLTVRDNLSVYLRVVERVRLGILASLSRSSAARERDRILELARQVALEDRLSVRAGELSGGERRRLELARALSIEPRVLVCDEPFAGVDPRQASRLGDMVAQLASERRVAVLLSDHHVAEALRVCSRALLLLDGAVAVEAPPAEFRDHPLVMGRYLGSFLQTAATLPHA